MRLGKLAVQGIEGAAHATRFALGATAGVATLCGIAVLGPVVGIFTVFALILRGLMYLSEAGARVFGVSGYVAGVGVMVGVQALVTVLLCVYHDLVKGNRG